LPVSQAVLDYVGSQAAASLSQQGAACPDHLVHTKRQPLFVDWQPEQGLETLKNRLKSGIETFVDSYKAYFAECSGPNDEMGDPYPRTILIPGLGMINTGADAVSADVSRQLYHRAIAVIDGSQSVSEFVSLSAQEAFDIEYWPLELYKLSLKPAPREMAGRIVAVTGAASGIGRATAYRLAQDGAHVAILDINLEGAKAVAEDLTQKYGFRRAIALSCNVTDEAAVAAAYRQIVLAYGGLDVVISNAGIAISAPIEETTVQDWNKTMDILGKGYFLVSREAFLTMPSGVTAISPAPLAGVLTGGTSWPPARLTADPAPNAGTAKASRLAAMTGRN
jgi:hypothetical protein